MKDSVGTLKPGQKISEDDVEIIKVGGYNIADDVIQNISDAIGKYVKLDLVAGDLLQERKLSDEIITDDKFLAQIPVGKVAISIAVENLAEGLSGKLRQGDIVRIFAGIETPEGENLTVTPPELKYIEVLAVTNPNLDDLYNGSSNNSSDEDNPSREIATVTVLADSKQSLMLAELNANSKIHLALVHRGEDEVKTNMLTEQEQYNNG